MTPTPELIADGPFPASWWHPDEKRLVDTDLYAATWGGVTYYWPCAVEAAAMILADAGKRGRNGRLKNTTPGETP